MRYAWWRGLIFALSILATATGVGLWLAPAGRGPIFAAAIVAACAVVAVTLTLRRPDQGFRETDCIEELDHNRQNELIRGTSLHLRELRYRYSVRSDRTAAGGRRPFSEVVHGIRLGFLPVILTDNDTDYQGYGYVAFVYDGRRWRGPGLPCPDGREQALAHARQNVSPTTEPPS